jgi:hypothetical protein
VRATSLAASLVTFDVAESPAARFTHTGRLAAAATLVLGAGFQLLAFLTMPEFDETLDRLRWIADHPARADSAKVFDVLALPFLFGSAVVYVFVSRTRSPRLAWAGGDPAGMRARRPVRDPGLRDPRVRTRDGRWLRPGCSRLGGGRHLDGSGDRHVPVVPGRRLLRSRHHDHCALALGRYRAVPLP